ncbi:hypothetical protein H0H81_009576 [Sphagnurus paluster]|uniref:Uncharacterized protein n=1 Tax=Sphagnurus paluster TaxID=117069 RepID=A0A9P7K2T1_9AGAR|nr:hypothetical protein H0H81_009576 [Sphagnurus paluster]
MHPPKNSETKSCYDPFTAILSFFTAILSLLSPGMCALIAFVLAVMDVVDSYSLYLPPTPSMSPASPTIFQIHREFEKEAFLVVISAIILISVAIATFFIIHKRKESRRKYEDPPDLPLPDFAQLHVNFVLMLVLAGFMAEQSPDFGRRFFRGLVKMRNRNARLFKQLGMRMHVRNGDHITPTPPVNDNLDYGIDDIALRIPLPEDTDDELELALLTPLPQNDDEDLVSVTVPERISAAAPASVQSERNSWWDAPSPLDLTFLWADEELDFDPTDAGDSQPATAICKKAPNARHGAEEVRIQKDIDEGTRSGRSQVCGEVRSEYAGNWRREEEAHELVGHEEEKARLKGDSVCIEEKRLEQKIEREEGRRETEVDKVEATMAVIEAERVRLIEGEKEKRRVEAARIETTLKVIQSQRLRLVEDQKEQAKLEAEKAELARVAAELEAAKKAEEEETERIAALEKSRIAGAVAQKRQQDAVRQRQIIQQACTAAAATRTPPEDLETRPELRYGHCYLVGLLSLRSLGSYLSFDLQSTPVLIPRRPNTIFASAPHLPRVTHTTVSEPVFVDMTHVPTSELTPQQQRRRELNRKRRVRAKVLQEHIGRQVIAEWVTGERDADAAWA